LLIDLLPALKVKDSSDVLLALSWFLLLTAYAVHFMDEPRM
jgi:hypothetical protein